MVKPIVSFGMRHLWIVLLLVLACAAPAFADATAFIGTTTTPANRPTKGVAVGVSLVIIGFEFESEHSGCITFFEIFIVGISENIELSEVTVSSIEIIIVIIVIRNVWCSRIHRKNRIEMRSRYRTEVTSCRHDTVH